MTLDLLILRLLIKWHLRNIGIPVVPPDVTLDFFILRQALPVTHLQIEENFEPVETLTC